MLQHSNVLVCWERRTDGPTLIIVAKVKKFNSQIIKTIKKWTKDTFWRPRIFMTQQSSCILSCLETHFLSQKDNSCKFALQS